MQALAVIPARGGSKGVPRKNVRLLCGKPLIAWTIEAARQAEAVGRVVVSTDDPEIAAVSRRWGADVVHRPAALSGDLSPSEQALAHALDATGVRDGILVFLQCTSPLTLPEDIDGTVRALGSRYDSAFAAVRRRRFLWRRTAGGAEPVGHDTAHRPMRQQLRDEFEEAGAVYALRVPAFLRAGHRFPGRTAVYEIPPDRSLEIDDESDFAVAETLLRRRLQRDKAAALPRRVEAVVMDFDGVLTDNRVHVGEGGAEAVTCHRGDGWAMARLRRQGVHLLVLTGEANAVVRRRTEKLGVECIVTDEKLPVLQAWLRRRRIGPEATVYVGNDVPDVPCMAWAGCGVAPADAWPEARAAARIVLDTPGGRGCIRELAQLLWSRHGSGGTGPPPSPHDSGRAADAQDR